jgi:hypothetical protein
VPHTPRRAHASSAQPAPGAELQSRRCRCAARWMRRQRRWQPGGRGRWRGGWRMRVRVVAREDVCVGGVLCTCRA